MKDFNLKTSIYKEGIPIPCEIRVNPDRTYNLAMSHPPFSYFIKQAAGIFKKDFKNKNSFIKISEVIFFFFTLSRQAFKEGLWNMLIRFQD